MDGIRNLLVVAVSTSLLNPFLACSTREAGEEKTAGDYGTPVHIDKKDGRYDMEGLRTHLKRYKNVCEEENPIVLMIEPNILYGDIIRIMDLCCSPEIGLTDVVLAGRNYVHQLNPER
jgi:hypothetical protein